MAVVDSSLWLPNYNYLYGTEVNTKKPFKGVTKEFELIKL